jgi:hypothetical protein
VLKVDWDSVAKGVTAEPFPLDVTTLDDLFGRLRAQPSQEAQQAIDAVTDFTRARMREEGFFRRIMPPIPITDDELDRSVDTDLPVRVVDREPDAVL